MCHFFGLKLWVKHIIDFGCLQHTPRDKLVRQRRDTRPVVVDHGKGPNEKCFQGRVANISVGGSYPLTATIFTLY